MFAKHPKIAKEFAEKTKSFKALPEHVKQACVNILKIRNA